MVAKDGRNTSRCLKKSCEVLVSTGNQFRISTSKGAATVVIEAVDAANGVTIGVYADSGFGGPINSGENPAPGELGGYNNVKLILVAISGKSLVLRLTR